MLSTGKWKIVRCFCKWLILFVWISSFWMNFIKHTAASTAAAVKSISSMGIHMVLRVFFLNPTNKYLESEVEYKFMFILMKNIWFNFGWTTFLVAIQCFMKQRLRLNFVFHSRICSFLLYFDCSIKQRFLKSTSKIKLNSNRSSVLKKLTRCDLDLISIVIKIQLTQLLVFCWQNFSILFRLHWIKRGHYPLPIPHFCFFAISF